MAFVNPKYKNGILLGADGVNPWYAFEPVLERFSLKRMQRLGLIDYLSSPPAPMPPVDTDFQVEASRKAMYKAPHEIDQPIHAVFRRQNWPSVGDNDWDLIYPALRLASCCLYEPSLLPYFAGLLRQPLEEILDAPHATLQYGRLDRFHLVPYEDTEQCHQEFSATWKTLIETQNLVTWDFGGNESQTAAQTTRVISRPGLLPGTFSSVVHIDFTFIEALRGTDSIRNYPECDTFDPEAARLRTYFLLANTLVHEFAHVLGFATITSDQEPFFENHRVAELGSALETFMFGHVSIPIGYNLRLNSFGDLMPSASAPYGVKGVNFPSPSENFGPALATPAYWGQHSFVFPYRTASIHRLFTRKHWEQQVASYGLEALKFWTPIVIATTEKPGPLDPHETGPIIPRPPQYSETLSDELEFLEHENLGNMLL